MRLIPIALVALILASCLPSRRSPLAPCLVAEPAAVGKKAVEPRWLRLTGLQPYSDTTGLAEIGLYGVTAMGGHWSRFGGDSLRIDAADAFSAVWLRLQIRNAGVSGQATIWTDAGWESTTPWRAAWAACPRTASRPAT